MSTRQFTSPLISPALFGRSAHLATAELFLTSQGLRVLLVSGEAGIGKSRFSAEIQRRAENQGFRALQASASDTLVQSPYSLIIDVLGPLLSSPDLRSLIQPLGALANDLAALVPEIIPYLTEHRFADSSLSVGEGAQRTFRALTNLFLEVASQRPLLLILEDLHWSDDISLDFLRHLARRAADRPLLIIMTYRNEEVNPGLLRLLSELERARLSGEISLPPLTKSETGAMIQAILQQSAPIRPAFAERVHTLTEGNPFFIEEVLKSLVNAGQLFQAFGRWDWQLEERLTVPKSVSRAIQMRFERLSVSAREIALIASVIGRHVDLGLLEALSSLSEEAVLGAVRELMEAQLLIEESTETFAFRHALTREAIYSTLLARERQLLHQRIGRLLERLDPALPSSHAGNVAYHFFEAGLWPECVQHYQRAGEHALNVHAPNLAISHFTRMFMALRQMGIEPPPAALASRARAYRSAGDFAGCQGDLSTALEMLSDGSDLTTKWEVLIELGMLWASRDYHQAGNYLQSAFHIAETSANDYLRARTLNRLGNWRLNMGHMKEAMLCHQEALEIFQAVGDDKGIAETLDLLGMSNCISGNLTEGARRYEGAIEKFRAVGDQVGLASALASLPLRGLTYNGDASAPATTDLRSCVQDGEAALELAQKLDWPAGEIYARFNLAFCLGPLGEYGNALSHAQAALRGAQEIEHIQWEAAARCALGALSADLLDWETASQYLQQALALAQQIRSAYWSNVIAGSLASSFVQQRAYDKAAAALRLSPPSGDGMAPGQRQVEAARAEMALARGEAKACLSLVDRLIADEPNCSPGGRILRISKLRADALLAIGRLPEAMQELTAAREAAVAMGAHPQLWRIHVSLAKASRAMGKRALSRAESDAAWAVVKRLAANVPQQNLRELFLRESAKAVRPVPITPSRAAKTQRSGLTERECEVVRLLAQGRSNRQMADELLITNRTVESHVSSIFAKLGLNSRSQVAAWAAEKGLLRK